MADIPWFGGNSFHAQKTPGNPVLLRPESHSARGNMFESALVREVLLDRHAQRPASTIERYAPPRENPACSRAHPRKSRPPASPAENRDPSPASASRPGCPTLRPQTLLTFPDIGAWCALCRGQAVRCAQWEIPYAAFLPDAPSPPQKNNHIGKRTSDNFLASAPQTRSSGTPGDFCSCDKSWKCCNSRIAPKLHNCGTTPT